MLGPFMGPWEVGHVMADPQVSGLGSAMAPLR